VKAGAVFMEDIENTGVRDFGACEQRESPVLQIGNGSGKKNAAGWTKGWALALC
jgi:hypothetical protein